MATFNIGSVTGNNNVFAEHATVTNYINANPEIQFSETDKKLIELIHLHEPSEEERSKLLADLNVSKKEDEEPKNKISALTRIVGFLDVLKPHAEAAVLVFTYYNGLLHGFHQ